MLRPGFIGVALVTVLRQEAARFRVIIAAVHIIYARGIRYGAGELHLIAEAAAGDSGRSEGIVRISGCQGTIRRDNRCCATAYVINKSIS